MATGSMGNVHHPAPADMARPPLREGSLRRALVTPHGLWTELVVTPETGSTNADLVAAARDGAPDGLILIAESQRAGRGRLGRSWVAPRRAGITVSVLLRPGPQIPPARWAWLALLAGVALVESVGEIAAVQAALKWPNDLLVRRTGGRDDSYGKCAGVLAESTAAGGDSGRGAGSGRGSAGGVGSSAGSGCGAGSGAVVLGIGLNVSQRAEELPISREVLAFPPTSLALAGAVCLDREAIMCAVLGGLAGWYERWRAVDGDPELSGLRDAYRAACVTIGSDVRVSLPDGQVLAGTATGIDADGHLVISGRDGRRSVAAGDVHHVR